MSRILAHHLYDFADCEHRVALDSTRPREERTPPDAAAELLFRRGLDHEREVADALGWTEVEETDLARAARTTRRLLGEGVPGVFQGVLEDGDRLARPDLLERRDGASELGAFHYVPGDVKSALAPRSDAALQVAFAGLLLEGVQGRRSTEGFLILGDGTRETIDLEAIRASAEEALRRVERIARGEAATTPFFSRACARCRWKGTCVPELLVSRDASLAFGMTRTLRRALGRHGIRSLADLASADPAGLRPKGAPTDGLDRLRRQARALLEGRAQEPRAVELPRGRRAERYLRIETDPVDGGAPFLFAWGSGAAGGGALTLREVAVARDAAERRFVVSRLLAAVEDGGEPVFTWGRSTARALDAVGDAAGLDPGRLGDLEGRLVDLAPAARRAGALPVFHYAFEEVAAVAQALPRPDPASPDDAAFVDFALWQGGDPAAAGRLERAGLRALDGVRAIRAWLPDPR